ncbi:MAG: DNA adenine methylase [Methanomicrobium sp.]|nr:DNA adenine methylase [Methanomicrobium sp.]
MAFSKKKSPANPFLKWAGGKSQILGELELRFPKELIERAASAGKKNKISKFVEPFVGGGAVYFLVNSKYRPDECHIFDVNEELILCYRVVKESPDSLTQMLRDYESEYLKLDEEKRQEFYYNIRSSYNQKKEGFSYSSLNSSAVERAASLIFLNKTCFNGLYRVNSGGGFNVPFGRYKNPKIAVEESINLASELLENTQIHNGDFEEAAGLCDERTFFYFDPPYRPINKTSKFNSYAKDGFSDDDQRRLARFFKECDLKSAKVMLSNSDPKNTDPDDNFFDSLYEGFRIERVPAKRQINSKGSGRGEINEIVVTNY